MHDPDGTVIRGPERCQSPRTVGKPARMCTWVSNQRCSWECLESWLGSVQSSRLGVCHQVQLGVYLRACSGVCLRATRRCTWERLGSLLGSVSQAGWECAIESNWECAIESNWERIVKQAGSVQSSAIRSVLQSLDGSVQWSASGSLLSSCMQHDVLYPVHKIAMIPPVKQWISPDRNRPVQSRSSPRYFWTGIRPIPNFFGPGLDWRGLLWTKPFGPNRPENAGSYWSTESTNRLILPFASHHAHLTLVM